MSHIALASVLGSLASVASVETMGDEAPTSETRKVEAAPTLDLPEVGSLTPSDFMREVRRMNVEWFEEKKGSSRCTMMRGTACAYPGRDRDGMIRAIAGFIGWDPSQPFGTQLAAAVQVAVNAIRPPTVSHQVRFAKVRQDRTMPLPGEVVSVLDLLGREAWAGDEVARIRQEMKGATGEAKVLLTSQLAQAEKDHDRYVAAVCEAAALLGTSAERLRQARQVAQF